MPLNALLANLAAAALPILPRVATFELLQASYGAPELLSPGVSTRISMFTCSRNSGTPKLSSVSREKSSFEHFTHNPAAKFCAVLTIRSCDCVRKTGIVSVKLLRSSPYN